jgi:hypothetical protein
MPRPKSDLAPVAIKLGQADREALGRLAAAAGTSKNQVIRDLIRAAARRRQAAPTTDPSTASS